MKLYLMRHGEYMTEDLQHTGALSKKGTNDINLIANFLKPANIHVSNIFHSGKLRAQQTAEIMATSIIAKEPLQARNKLDPQDDVTAFIDEIIDWEQDLLVVGHLPFMGRLVSKLVVGNENKEIVAFYPGTLVCLERIENSPWIIDWVLFPDLFLGS